MVDKVKIEPKIIVIPEGRLSFFRSTPEYRRNKQGQEVKTRADGSPVKPRVSWTWLLDPSKPEIQTVIKEITSEAARILDLFYGGRDKWPKDNQQTGTKGIIQCFGYGNKLPKVYDGYKDMFFIKVSDTVLPIFGDRQGRQVMYLKGDQQWHYVDKATGETTEEVADPRYIPYAGAFCRGRISLYVYDNESAGVNANARSAQFLRPGEAFGGGGRRNVNEELEAMSGDAPSSLEPEGFGDDPFG